MARSVQISLASAKADLLLDRIQNLECVAGTARQRGVSVDPPGDIVTVQVTNDGLRELMRTLSDLDITDDGSVAVSQLAAFVAPGHQKAVDEEGDTLPWEEAMTQLQETSNPTPNFVLSMALSGGIAAVAFWNNQLLLLLAAQLIGPHFEVLLRVPLGIVVRSRAMVGRGLIAIAGGYVCRLGSGRGAVVLGFAGARSHAHGRFAHALTGASVLDHRHNRPGNFGAGGGGGRRDYSVAAHNFAVGRLPGAGARARHGAVRRRGVAASRRRGVALAAGDWILALHALKRWSLDAGATFLVGGAIFALAQVTVERRMALNQIAARKVTDSVG